jgi:hypothetical protein
MKRRIGTIFLTILGMGIAACSDSSTGPGETILTPIIQGISPEIGTVGTEVRIEGSNFSASNTDVFFGTLQSPQVELEGGALFALAPEGLTEGQVYDIRVVNRGTQSSATESATLASGFQAVAPRALRVNGVTRPTGLKGMTIIVEGTAFSDVADYGSIWFLAEDGTPIEATVADPEDDWANTFVVTTVPQAVGDTTAIWIETPTGASDPIEFLLIQTAGFSPSVINWTRTTDLPQGLQGLDAAFVPIEAAGTSENWVYVVGGADGELNPVADVMRAPIQEDGSIGSWDTGLPALPEARAFHTLAAATAFTAALDTTTTSAYLYALGGIDEDGAVVSSVFMGHVGLDGQIASWETARSLPEALHSPGAVIFRGYLYLAGGADAAHAARDAMYRARIREDGSLGEWESLDALPQPRAYFSLVSFGPYLYAVGGETEVSEPSELRTTTETASVQMARINLRTGGLRDTWASAGDGGSTPKARSKHSTIFAGGFLFTSSGLYSGLAGSSENEYSAIGDGGMLSPWSGATGVNTILNRLGYSLYNQAAISFVDSQGNGHVLILGGGQVENAGEVSEAVIFF